MNIGEPKPCMNTYYQPYNIPIFYWKKASSSKGVQIVAKDPFIRGYHFTTFLNITNINTFILWQHVDVGILAISSLVLSDISATYAWQGWAMDIVRCIVCTMFFNFLKHRLKHRIVKQKVRCFYTMFLHDVLGLRKPTQRQRA